MGISISNLTRQQDNKAYTDLQIEVKGFNKSEIDPQNESVKKKLQDCINVHKQEVAKNQHWYFWLNFVVTLLTAGSTLVSSIQAARDKPALTSIGSLNKFAVAIASLTFISTLTNFGATHYNELKNNAAQSVAVATQTLNDYYRKYDATTSVVEHSKLNREYGQKICD